MWFDLSRKLRRRSQRPANLGVIERLESRQLMAASASITAMTSAMEGGVIQFRASLQTDYYPTPTTTRTYIVGIGFASTASQGTDYYWPSPASVTIVLPPYATTGSGTLDVETRRDNLVEGSETLIGQVESLSGPNAGAVSDPPPSATATIGDDPARVSIEGGRFASEVAGDHILTARRSGGDTSQRLTATLEVSGAAIRGEDYSVPGSVTFEPGVSFVEVPVTILDDDQVEAPEGNFVWEEHAVFAIAPNASAYVVAGSPTTVSIGDDVDWVYSGWEPVQSLLTFTATQLGDAQESAGALPGERYVDTWHLRSEWRYLGLTDMSDDWGRAADLTGRGVTFSGEQTDGEGTTLEANLNEFGVPIAVGGSWYSEWTSGTALSHTVTDGRTAAERNALYQVSGHGLYNFVEKRRTVFQNGRLDRVESDRRELGFTGEISGASKNRQRRLWLEGDAERPAGYTQSGPAAPPGPAAVTPASY